MLHDRKVAYGKGIQKHKEEENEKKLEKQNSAGTRKAKIPILGVGTPCKRALSPNEESCSRPRRTPMLENGWSIRNLLKKNSKSRDAWEINNRGMPQPLSDSMQEANAKTRARYRAYQVGRGKTGFVLG